MNKKYKVMVKAMDHFNLAHNGSQKPSQQYSWAFIKHKIVHETYKKINSQDKLENG
jgi:hypothetical protein